MAVIQTDNFANNRDQVTQLENTEFCRVWQVNTKALVQFITTDTAVVKAFEIKEHTLNHGARIINGRQITWTQAAVDFNQGFIGSTGWVFFESGIDIFDLTCINISKEAFDVRGFVVTKGTE